MEPDCRRPLNSVLCVGSSELRNAQRAGKASFPTQLFLEHISIPISLPNKTQSQQRASIRERDGGKMKEDSGTM